MDGLLRPIVPMEADVTTTRQLLGDTFYLDHQVWAIRVRDGRLPESGHQPWDFMGSRVRGVENEEMVIDVHTPADVAHSEMWLRGHGFTEPAPGKPVWKR